MDDRIPGLSAAVPALPVIPPPAIPLISVFPDPVPSGATALIYINAADPNASSMTFVYIGLRPGTAAHRRHQHLDWVAP